MILKNGDCDLICKGCEMESEPEKCINNIFEDVKDIAINSIERPELKLLMDDLDDALHKYRTSRND